jgi:DNA-directed RNA polymerase specialized sigma24 family protein
MDWELFKDETTADLIAGMAITNRPEETEISDAIFWAFILRFRERVQKKCRIVALKMGYNDAIADDIATESFRKFRSCTTFKAENCKNWTYDDCVEIYIEKIATRLLCDYRRNELHPKIEIPENEIFWELPDLDALDIAPERKALLQKQHDLINKVLESLPLSHKVIYLTYKFYEGYLEDNQYIPRSVSKRLQDEFGISQNSIRVYKKAAFEKVALYLNLYGNN